MIIIIEDEDLEMAIEGIFQGKYKKYKSNKGFQNKLSSVISIIDGAKNYQTLCGYRSLACEALVGDRVGTYSMRIGYTYKERLIFTIEEDEIHIHLIEISEHYGDH